MERKFLEGLGLGKSEVDKVMAAHGAGLERAKQKVAQALAERDELAGRLGGAELELETLRAVDAQGLREAAEGWEAKWREDTEALHGQLEDERYAVRARTLAAKEHFSCGAAKQAFEAELLAQKLPMAEGEGLEGYDDFRTAFAAADPMAFMPSTPMPMIVAPLAAAPREDGWREKAARNFERAKYEEF